MHVLSPPRNIHNFSFSFIFFFPLFFGEWVGRRVGMCCLSTWPPKPCPYHTPVISAHCPARYTVNRRPLLLTTAEGLQLSPTAHGEATSCPLVHTVLLASAALEATEIRGSEFLSHGRHHAIARGCCSIVAGAPVEGGAASIGSGSCNGRDACMLFEFSKSLQELGIGVVQSPDALLLHFNDVLLLVHHLLHLSLFFTQLLLYRHQPETK